MTNHLPNVQAVRPIPKSSVDTPISSSSVQEVGPGAGTGQPLSQAPVVYVDLHIDPFTRNEFVLWEDIQLAFEGALHVRHLARVVPFLKGPDFRPLEPRRIAAVPNVVLDVVINDPVIRAEALPGQLVPPVAQQLTTQDLVPPPQKALLETPSQETAPPPPQKALLEPECPTQESSFKVEVETGTAGTPSSFSEGATVTTRRDPHGNDNDNNRPTELSSATTPSRRSPQAPQDLSLATVAMGNSQTVIDASHGDTSAQVALGDKFTLGLEGDRDYEEAMDWYLRAANAGDASAQNKIGDLYRLGHGVPQDCSVAMDWYRKAADQDDATGLYNVGQMYDYALGVPVDYSTAMECYLNQEFAEAEFRIGAMFEMGQGVPKDESAALEWFNRTIKHGENDGWASYSKGYLCFRGIGVPQDSAMAYEWFLKAAQQGLISAQIEVGNMLFSGI
ncbi:hypothetical protein BGZ95_007433, partial [Linnemannia exigua]